MFDMSRVNIKIKEHFEYLYNPEFHDDYLLKICEQEKYIRRAKIVKGKELIIILIVKMMVAPAHKIHTLVMKSLCYMILCIVKNNKFADFNIDDKKLNY